MASSNTPAAKHATGTQAASRSVTITGKVKQGPGDHLTMLFVAYKSQGKWLEANLENSSVEMPPGTYTLDWLFRGDPGTKFEAEILLGDNVIAKTGVQTMPSQMVRLDSWKFKLAGYKPITFTIEE
jgi:hypothetical protein